MMDHIWPEKYAGQQRGYDFDFMVGVYPILKPDEDVEIGEEALDSEESGRDESGFMHIHNLRPSVKFWVLKYSNLCSADYRYLRKLIMRSGSFSIRVKGEYVPDLIPFVNDDNGIPEEYQVYCRKYGITLRNKKTGDFRNLSFKIIEC